jgi:dihydroxyacid dehydratase/phosphogluconate dehydratase
MVSCISAMAREAGIPLTIEDFDVISSRTPLLADLKPGDAMRRSICTAPVVFLSWPSA